MLDPSALCHENVGALVTDGANAICGRFAATPLIVASLGLTVAAAFAWRASGAWRNRLVVATVALSAPGIVALAARRADAPRSAWTTAARLEIIEGAIEEEANATGCAPRAFACAACEPIARYARARAPACRTASASALTSRAGPACEEEARELVCGER